MISVERQCATIQVTVHNVEGNITYQSSFGPAAYYEAEKTFREAIKLETVMLEGKICNVFYDRISEAREENEKLEAELVAAAAQIDKMVEREKRRRKLARIKARKAKPKKKGRK